MRTTEQLKKRAEAERARRAAMTPDEKAAFAVYMKEYRKKNPEKLLAIEKKTRLKNREARLECKSLYRKENKEKIYAYNIEYERAHPEMVYHISAKKRAKRKLAIPPFYDHENVCAVYRTSRALTKSTGVKHHVDHIIPLKGRSVCGLHVSCNLQILTAAENLRKSNNWGP